MSRLTLAAIVAAALAAAACGNNSTTTPTPITPDPVTDTFNGTVTVNGASNFPFSVSSAGLITVTLTSLAGDGTVVGLSLGTWTAATSSCSAIISNDTAVQGSILTGQATSIGNLCARVFDVGRISEPQDYQLTVVHY
jgi:hypothetical protein